MGLLQCHKNNSLIPLLTMRLSAKTALEVFLPPPSPLPGWIRVNKVVGTVSGAPCMFDYVLLSVDLTISQSTRSHVD